MSTVYTGPSSTGAGTGANYSNLKAITSYTQTSGDLVYMIGGPYTSFPDLTVANVEYRRAIIADHGTATGWSDSFDTPITCTKAAPVWYIGAQNITINGQTGGTDMRTGLTDTYGISLTSTSMGTADGQSTIACRGTNVSHLRLKHIELIAPTSAGSAANSYYAFEERTFVYGSTVSTDVGLQNVHLKGGLCNLVFTGNGTTDQSNVCDFIFVEDAGHQQHSESIQLANTKNVTFKHFVFKNILDPSTTFIEPQQNGGPQCSGIFILAGIFWNDDPVNGGTENPTVISMTSGETCTFVRIYNCTMYGLRAPNTGFQDTGVGMVSNGVNSTDIEVKNCLWQNCLQTPSLGGTGITAASNRLNTGPLASFSNPTGGDFTLLSDTTNITSRTALLAPFDTLTDGKGLLFTSSIGADQYQSPSPFRLGFRITTV